MAKFIYSLRPPANPNPVSDLSRRGARVFDRAGCARCHAPPLYTNNRLTLVGTDPNLTTRTRKATGLYRVQSLRMLWLEAALLHDGSIGSLEELFDKSRLDSDFRSSNWFPSAPANTVPGHRFGLELPADDRAALIAFRRTQ